MPTGARGRLIATSIDLVRRRGVAGTGLTELIERSGAARRSIYQHFPGGKTELITCSTTTAGKVIGLRLHTALAEHAPADVLAVALVQIAANLREQDYALGCPIAAAASAVPEEDTIRGAAATAFSGWAAEWEEALVRDGYDHDSARSLASFIISSIEGALLVARAARSTEALDLAAVHLGELLARHRPDPGPLT